MTTKHATFVDNDTTMANRVAADFLNDLNNTNYSLLGGAPGTSADNSPPNRTAIATNLLTEYFGAKGQLITTAVGPVPALLSADNDGLALQTNSTVALGIKWTSLPQVCQGRLTLATATPVTASDQTGKTTLYFTPYKGNVVSLYDSTSLGAQYWRVHTLSEISISTASFTVSKPHDIFIYDNAGTLTLSAVAWTNNTARATALALQDGVYCKTGTLSQRYVGTVYADGSKQLADSVLKRNVWNYDNRVVRTLRLNEATASWNYTTAAFEQVRASAANQFELVVGVSEDMVEVMALAQAANSAGGILFSTGIGIDSTTVNSAGIYGSAPSLAAGAGVGANVQAWYQGYPGVGWHTIPWLEYSAATGTTTWYGQGAGVNTGMFGQCLA